MVLRRPRRIDRANELGLLAEAKANSDAMTAMELEAMDLAVAGGTNGETDREKAEGLLYGAEHHRAKAAILRPIKEAFDQMEKRRVEGLRDAEQAALSSGSCSSCAPLAQRSCYGRPGTSCAKPWVDRRGRCSPTSKGSAGVFDIEPGLFEEKPETLMGIIHPEDLEAFSKGMTDNRDAGTSSL